MFYSVGCDLKDFGLEFAQYCQMSRKNEKSTCKKYQDVGTLFSSITVLCFSATHQQNETCSICWEPMQLGQIGTKTPKKLTCLHRFHMGCLVDWARKNRASTCPLCQFPFGSLKGLKLQGATMEVTSYKFVVCPGFRDAKGTIEILYNVPPGIQQVNGPLLLPSSWYMYLSNYRISFWRWRYITWYLNQSCNKPSKEGHPNPGMQYGALYVRAFLPNNARGRKVALLLQYAFKAGLVLTIGTSSFTGCPSDAVTWNGISHKTQLSHPPYNFNFPILNGLNLFFVISCQDWAIPTTPTWIGSRASWRRWAFMKIWWKRTD